MATRVLEDVGGSFAAFKRNAPKVFRAALLEAVHKTTFAVEQRLHATAPVGPDAPHIRDEMTSQMRGLTGRAGIFDNDEQAHVALFNEYSPNHQPFMRASADAEADEFLKRVTRALQLATMSLTSGLD
jgi:hypothetical protein